MRHAVRRDRSGERNEERLMRGNLETTPFIIKDRERTLPRLAKIALGVRVRGAKSEFPREVDYFVLPPPLESPDLIQPWRSHPSYPPLFAKFQQVYGPTPKFLDIVLPTDDIGVCFPRHYKAYGTGGRLKCIGDGRSAERIGAMLGREGDEAHKWFGIDCPGHDCEFYQGGQCGLVGNLFVMLPRVTVAGLFQIDTGSITSMTDLDADLAVPRMLFGRADCLIDRDTDETVLILTRELKRIQFGGSAANHWPLRIRVRNAAEFDYARARSISVGVGDGGNLLPMKIDARNEIEADLVPASLQAASADSAASAASDTPPTPPLDAPAPPAAVPDTVVDDHVPDAENKVPAPTVPGGVDTVTSRTSPVPIIKVADIQLF